MTIAAQQDQIAMFNEYETVLGFVIDEYESLRRLSPNHYLLKFIEDPSIEKFRVTPEFTKMYYPKEKGEKTIKKSLVSLDSYHSDLQKAVIGKLRKIIQEERRKLGLVNNMEEGERILWERIGAKGLTGLVRGHLTHNRRRLLV